jgi:hypothetical protein
VKFREMDVCYNNSAGGENQKRETSNTLLLPCLVRINVARSLAACPNRTRYPLRSQIAITIQGRKPRLRYRRDWTSQILDAVLLRDPPTAQSSKHSWRFKGFTSSANQQTPYKSVHSQATAKSKSNQGRTCNVKRGWKRRPALDLPRSSPTQ